MEISFWDDSASKKLEREGENTLALFWKLSNLVGKLSILGWICAIAVGVLAIGVLAMSNFDSGVPAFAILAGIAAALGFFAGTIFLVYVAFAMFLAYKYKEYAWLVAIFFVHILAVAYKYFKDKEIMEGQLPSKEDKVQKYFGGK